LVNVLAQRSEIRLETGKCWSTPEQVTVRD
jgi:hypothetical protein